MMDVYVKTEIPEYNQDKEEGIKIGISYRDLYGNVYNTIDNAAQEEELSLKMKTLATIKRYIPHLYKIVKENPDSRELKAQQKGLEELAERHGFVITEKGIFLDSK